jgi:hypothetical protein
VKRRAAGVAALRPVVRFERDRIVVKDGATLE